MLVPNKIDTVFPKNQSKKDRSTPPPTLCDQCEEADAQVTCPTCQEQYCLSCDEIRHQSKKSKTHPRFLNLEGEEEVIPRKEEKYDSPGLSSSPSSNKTSPPGSRRSSISSSTSSLNFSRFCTFPEHKDIEFNLFCQSCFKLICSRCILSEHKGHSFIPLNAAVEKVKDALSQTVSSLRLQITKREELIKAKAEERYRKLKELYEEKRLLKKDMRELEETEILLRKSGLDSNTFLSLVSGLKPLERERADLFQPLTLWLRKPLHEWNLLYQWSRDGKTAKAFHAKCDDHGPTVTIVWANDGYVFGGYAAVPWESPPGDILIGKESRDSFLFSLTDNTQTRRPYRCLPSSNLQACLLHHSCYGPIWGYENDLYLGLAAEGYEDSGEELRKGEQTNFSSCLGGTYELPEGFKDPQTFLAGKERGWKVKEIEVYSV